MQSIHQIRFDWRSSPGLGASRLGAPSVPSAPVDQRSASVIPGEARRVAHSPRWPPQERFSSAVGLPTRSVLRWMLAWRKQYFASTAIRLILNRQKVGLSFER